MLGSVLIKGYLLVLMVMFLNAYAFIKTWLGFKVISLSFLKTDQAEQLPHGEFGAIAAELVYFLCFCMLLLVLSYWLKMVHLPVLV